MRAVAIPKAAKVVIDKKTIPDCMGNSIPLIGRLRKGGIVFPFMPLVEGFATAEGDCGYCCDEND